MFFDVVGVRNGDCIVDFIIYKCDECGTEIESCHPHIAENANQNHYCGECAFKLGKITDEQFINQFLYACGWGVKAGIHPETGEIEITYNSKFSWQKKDKDYRKTVQYGQWRKNVFLRDDYTCQACGARGGNLEAHHIKSFSKHKLLRFDINNGVTLCKGCHKKIHAMRCE